MQVDRVLELLGNRSLTIATPEATQIAELINKELQLVIDIAVHTGNSVFELLKQYDTVVVMKILNTQLNDGIDYIAQQIQTAALRDAAQDKFEQGRRNGKMLQALMSLGCGTLLALQIVTLCYCMFNNITLPEWEIILIMLAVPGSIVLNTNGVFSQENKQMLQATLGAIPPVGTLGMIVGAITKQRRSADQQPAQYYQPSYGASASDMRPYPVDMSSNNYSAPMDGAPNIHPPGRM